MYNYTFYHALYSVRVSISHYVLHIAMFLLLIKYSSKYKSYASEPYLPGHNLVSCSSKYKYNRVYCGTICTKSRVSSRRCRLERAMTIDHRKKHKTHSCLRPMAVVRSKECTTSAMGGSGGVELESLLHRTRLQYQLKKRFLHRNTVPCANSSDNVYRTPTYDSACNLASSRPSCGVSELHFSG